MLTSVASQHSNPRSFLNLIKKRKLELEPVFSWDELELCQVADVEQVGASVGGGARSQSATCSYSDMSRD